MLVSKNQDKSTLRPKTDFDRLSFLKSFLRGMGLANGDAAKVMKCTTANVSYMLCKQNDIKLSMAQKIIETYGHTLTVYLGEQKDNSNVVLDDNMMVVAGDKMQFKRLFFLSIAMKREGLNKMQLSDRIGVWVTSVRSWFSADDIYVSRLYQCAQALNLDVHWVIRPNGEIPRRRSGDDVESYTHVEFQNKQIVRNVDNFRVGKGKSAKEKTEAPKKKKGPKKSDAPSGKK